MPIRRDWVWFDDKAHVRRRSGRSWRNMSDVLARVAPRHRGEDLRVSGTCKGANTKERGRLFGSFRLLVDPRRPTYAPERGVESPRPREDRVLGRTAGGGMNDRGRDGQKVAPLNGASLE